MLALKIIGGILLVLLLLLVCPLRLEVSFEEEFTLTLRYLFLKFRLLPAREKPEKPEKKKKKPKKEPGPEESPVDKLKEIFKRTGVRGLVSALTDLAKLAVGSLKRVFRHLRFKAFDLYLCVGGAKDAAEAAVRYGEFSGAVYTAVGVFFGLKPCKKLGVTVDLDYAREEAVAVFSAKVSILPLFLAREGVSLFFRGFPIVWRLIRPPKQQALPAARQASESITNRPDNGAKGESV